MYQATFPGYLTQTLVFAFVVESENTSSLMESRFGQSAYTIT